ncbi:unnamed protein product [Aphanomyces euteiches]|nr:hypothetical protein Ae201684P_018311 [Aphanomyces euteiches]
MQEPVAPSHVKWSKQEKQFIPHESTVKSTQEGVRQHPRLTPDYVGSVTVATMTEKQVQQFFSRNVFREEYIASVPPGELYPNLCSGIDFTCKDIAQVALNRRAVELFLECYDVFLAILVRSQPALASEYMRCANVNMHFGRFAAARACCQAYLMLDPATSEGKAVILQARHCEKTLEKCKTQSQKAQFPPRDVVVSLINEIDCVLAVAPLLIEALHVKAGILLAAEAYDDLVAVFTSLPPALMDVPLTLALSRALDYSGHTQQALSELKKFQQPSPIIRAERQRLQDMLDKRAHAMSLAQGGHFAAAADAFQACLNLDVHHRLFNASIFCERAGTWLALGQEQKAIQDANRCLELHPTHAMAAARVHSAMAQAETSRMRSQLYKEQRARDKQIGKKSHASFFLRVGSYSNLASRDQVQFIQEKAAEEPKKPKFAVPTLAPLVDLYNLLGVSKAASTDVIKKAHRRLALQVHPDKSKSLDTDEQFKRIAMAYSILGDADARAQYDRVYNSMFYHS